MNQFYYGDNLVSRCGVRGRPATPTASATRPCPARRRTSSWSETARQTGSARSAALESRLYRFLMVQAVMVVGVNE